VLRGRGLSSCVRGFVPIVLVAVVALLIAERGVGVGRHRR
jgi:hypothetical protein